MSGLGVIIEEKAPVAGVTATADSDSAMVLHAMAVTGKFVLDTTYKIQSLRDLKVLGIDAAYDDTNNVLVYYHIKEFYRMVGYSSLTVLYIMGVSQAISYSAMIEDTASIYAKSMALTSKGAFKQITFVFNPITYTPTMVNGVDPAVVTAIGKAQLLHDWSVGASMPFAVVIEGKGGFTGTVSSMQDFRTLTGIDAPNVQVCFGQDWTKAEEKAIYNKHAAVGTLLGSIAARAVNESAGWVEVGNIQNTTSEDFVKVAISNHTLIDAYYEDWDTLKNKSVVFGLYYPIQGGIYWCSSNTCTMPTIDITDNSVNPWNMPYARTLNKAMRSLYAALITSVQSPQAVNPSNGKLPASVVVSFKSKAEDRIKRDMSGEISGLLVTIDPNSDLINAPRELKAGVQVVPQGSTDTLRVSIGLAKKV